MGFKTVDHRLGAILFVALFILGIPAAVFSTLPYQMAFIGSLVWVFGKMSLEKNIDDRNDRQFDYLKYMDAEWDNLAMNAGGVFIFVPQMRNIVEAINHHVTAVEYTDLWYYTAGILSDGLYILMLKVAALKRRYESNPKDSSATKQDPSQPQ